MDFHWRLSNSKSLQVSRTLLSILAVFNNAVVCMVFSRSTTSKSSRPFHNTYVTAPILLLSLILLFLTTFFMPAFADGLSFDSKTHQVFSYFLDSFQFKGRSPLRCNLFSLDSSSKLQFPVILFQASWDNSRGNRNNLHHF